jgi:hypothetical protein
MMTSGRREWMKSRFAMSPVTAVQQMKRASLTGTAILAALAIVAILSLSLGRMSCTALGHRVDPTLTAIALALSIALALFVYDRRCNPPRERVNVFVIALFLVIGVVGGVMNVGLHWMFSALRNLLIS